ncbi:hypothetical protein I6J17_12435 [Heyndrickxia coagulans]|uniref:Uncharacterized protein n=1 Tax=Heyndrickxia coagulans DSM 1 = ATCC 7050 TaxID=1121088 RepID=A0A8B4BX20_HEYCO|nr:hypothetical protein [Heyndrickxia coagulans]AJH78469.1 putative lipoprotein [Heyndrickxia coagulans DSM 1 = ATCC 7050]MCR2846603.1 hypothetical protein [Heyndrickxia coagulans]MDR4224316.1 hypothetical protein [Heyndrickxia coagulans DSM 1 = ATCC 7050]QJE32467.1 hypothetical protein HHU11_07440 [Heyndrickxia coagulans]QQS91739.1 hypothetical protein I6J17_12435 [Heyndrickxia coagulans]
MVRQVKKTKSFLLTAAFIAFNFCFFTNISVAESPATDGFIIEADRVEGVMLPPEITAGDTAIKQNQVMLRLQYADVTIYGLKITKVLQTPEGPVTIHMNAPGPIQLKNMKDDATKVDFGSIYVPEKAGQIGMKNVRLVAHQQLADNADLPGLDLSMETGAANIDTSGSDEETLRKQADQLTQLLKGGTSDQNKEEKNGKPVTADKAKAGTQDKAKTETQDTEKQHDAKTDGKVTDQNKNKNKKPENADDTKTKNAEGTESDNTGTKPASGQETEKNGTPAKTAPSQSTDKNVQQKEGSNAGN